MERKYFSAINNNSTYMTSKIGWSALSRIQQREMAQDPMADIVINHVRPGHVDTDMSSHMGHLSIDTGTTVRSWTGSTGLFQPSSDLIELNH